MQQTSFRCSESFALKVGFGILKRREGGKREPGGRRMKKVCECMRCVYWRKYCVCICIVCIGVLVCTRCVYWLPKVTPQETSRDVCPLFRRGAWGRCEKVMKTWCIRRLCLFILFFPRRPLIWNQGLEAWNCEQLTKIWFFQLVFFTQFHWVGNFCKNACHPSLPRFYPKNVNEGPQRHMGCIP